MRQGSKKIHRGHQHLIGPIIGWALPPWSPILLKGHAVEELADVCLHHLVEELHSQGMFSPGHGVDITGRDVVPEKIAIR